MGKGIRRGSSKAAGQPPALGERRVGATVLLVDHPGAIRALGLTPPDPPRSECEGMGLARPTCSSSDAASSRDST
jgi:hypothetical protein